MSIGLEPQWRWQCSCGVRVGYQCIPFEEKELLTTNKQDRENKQHTNTIHLYILSDALVMNQKDSKLSQAIPQNKASTKKK